jgi:DNA modification methylase
MEVKGRFGKCVFGNCLELLDGCEEFDVAFVDPPYNVHTSSSSYFLDKFNFDVGRRPEVYDAKDGVIPYENDFSEPDYRKFCTSWFEKLRLKCKRIVITPGYNNLTWWMSNYPELKIGIWLKRNGINRGSFSLFARWEPVLFFGKFNRCYIDDFFDVITRQGFLREDDSIIHPHPKPAELIENLLLPMNPTSVLDIMLGSGTTSFICEKHGIKWLGFELVEDYKHDIEKRIDDGVKAFVPNRKKTAQVKVI